MRIIEFTYSDKIEQLQKGNVSAFNSLYAHYAKGLLRMISYQVKDIDLAKDITQDVFLALWKNRETLDPTRDLKPYLNVIAKYLIINSYRKAAGNRKMIDKMMTHAVDFYTHSEEALSYKETTAIIENAIATLTAHQQVIYRKCRLEGKSHEEIAGELGISKSTVNNQIVKANQKVIEYLKKNEKLALTLFLAIISRS